MRRLAIIGGLATACLALAAPAAAKPPPKPLVFKVELEFLQTREWAFYHQQVGTDCSSTTQGNGSDAATLKGKAIFNLQKGRRGFAGIASGGTHSREGTMTHDTGVPNFPGADCGGPAQHSTDPNTGCGPKPTFLSSAALDYVGKTILLQWDGSQSSAPDFPDCPYHAGDVLPDDSYGDVDATAVARKDFLKATKKNPMQVTGHTGTSAVETCETVREGCPAGVTSNSSATLESYMTLTFTPKKR